MAIYIRNNLNTFVKVSTSVPGQFELLAITVELGHHGCPLVIVGVYRPPSACPDVPNSLYPPDQF